MKKYIVLIACLACASVGYAQRASSSTTSFFSTEKGDARVRLGIRGGLNVAKLHLSDDDDSENTDSRPGFHVGLNLDVPITQSLYFQTGLFFTQKGFKEKEGSVTYKGNPGYLEVPLMASYRYNFNDNIQFQLATGPYLAVGICGKYKYENTNGTEADIDYFGDDGADFKRFDMGWQVGAGFSIHRVYIGYTFQAGFLNTADSDVNFRTRNHMISVGYDF